VIRRLFRVRFLLLVLPVMLAGAWPVAAQAASGTGPSAGFAVLADSTGLTCTGSTVTGAVGVAAASTPITNTGCTMPTVQVASGAYADFLNVYSGIAGNLAGCTVLSGTLAGRSLGAGTYCFPAAAALAGTLTLTGNGPWLFEIGTGPTGGALTATGFTIVGSNPCNATWWVRDAVTLSTSTFQGTVLAGVDITTTNTNLHGRLLAKGAVSMTTSQVAGCTGGIAVTGGRGHGDNDGDNDKQCNQGDGHDSQGDGHDSQGDGHDSQGDGHDSKKCDSGDSDKKDKSNDEHGAKTESQGHHGGD
jgi:hypothetical protein